RTTCAVRLEFAISIRPAYFSPGPPVCSSTVLLRTDTCASAVSLGAASATRLSMTVKRREAVKEARRNIDEPYGNATSVNVTVRNDDGITPAALDALKVYVIAAVRFTVFVMSMTRSCAVVVKSTGPALVELVTGLRSIVSVVPAGIVASSCAVILRG